ncbi:MAG: response regulator [Candidatus Micrarchaeota archaeon]|nr:response regulator [Candidatus Micrarchaeota archaeon]
MEEMKFKGDEGKEKNNEIAKKGRIDPLDDIIHHKNQKKNIVLILEDNQTVLKLYDKAFKGLNCRFLTTLKEGEEELKRLDAEKLEPAVIVADFHLPDGESTEFINRIKERYPKIKVILSSSDDSAEFKVKHDVVYGKGQILSILFKIKEYLSE